MTLKAWIHENRELVADQRIFQVFQMQAVSPRTGEYRRLSVLQATDWVNVVALTPQKEVVLVRQFRHGTREFTLEIPGGMVDPGETPAQAAARELLEESGFAGDDPVALGAVSPNPALFDNHCHSFLIGNCRKIAEPALDHGEDIEVLLKPWDEIPAMIAAGGIGHALVICAFWWAFSRQNSCR